MNRLAFLLALPALVIGCSSAAEEETPGRDSKSIVAAPGDSTKPEQGKPGVTNPPSGEPCGNTTCGEGLVCCNASCGICTKPDMACIQIACEPEPPPPEEEPCFKTGCSGQICADEHIATTCEWREEYACYQNAICERQADGKCGFRPTKELTSCLSGGKK
jgi:eight-cysteine-cluster-containing protein